MSALACLALAALAGAVQERAPTAEELRAAALESESWLERRERFRRAWMEAGLEGRARARAELARALPPRAPQGAQPRLVDLERARWLLAHEHPPGPLERAAQALALRAVPGAFEAEGGALGTRVQVELRAEWRAPLPADGACELLLAWLGPRGERLEATRRPLAQDALELPLALELGAPAVPAGAWRLAAELVLRAEGEQLRAAAAPLELQAVPELGARLDVVRRARRQAREALASGALPGPMAHQVDAFLALVDEGRRPSSGLGPDALWEQLVRWPRPPERSEPWPLVGVEDGAGALWELAPAAGEVAAVVLVGPPSEPPEAWLAGLRGASWRAAAERAGWSVLALGAPFSPARVAELAARLAEERGIRRLVLVASGASVDAALAQADGLEAAGVGRLALLTALGASGDERPLVPEGLALPALLVDAGAALDGREHLRGSEAGRRKSFVLQRRVDPLLVVELELPWLVADWLSEERPADGPARAPR